MKGWERRGSNTGKKAEEGGVEGGLQRGQLCKGI